MSEVGQNFHGSMSAKYNSTCKRSEASDHTDSGKFWENCPSRMNLKILSNFN